ncbi:MAG: hypothetical protein QXY59_03720, partial [Candidatus Korarchaeota archaeon]
ARLISRNSTISRMAGRSCHSVPCCSKYFTSSKGAALFALTTQVLGYAEWTPNVVETRHTELTAKLVTEWELN